MTTPDFKVFPLAGWRGLNRLPHPRKEGKQCPEFYLWDSYENKRGIYKHHAIDIMCPEGTKILAVDDGYAWTNEHFGTYQFHGDGGGWFCYLATGKFIYLFSHMAEPPLVRPGDKIKAGQLLGYVGRTGSAAGGCPHLHFGSYKQAANGSKGMVINPYYRLEELVPEEGDNSDNPFLLAMIGLLAL